MPKVVYEVHDVILRVPAILYNDYVIVMEISRLTSIVAIERNWMELGQDLGGEKRNIEHVENNLEEIFLFEHGYCQVAQSLGLINQVDGHELIAFVHVLVFDYL